MDDRCVRLIASRIDHNSLSENTMKSVIYTLVVVFILSNLLLRGKDEGSEPSYNGRTLKSWFTDLGPLYLHMETHVYERSDQAKVAFQKMGPDSIPYILPYIANEASHVNQDRAQRAFWGLGELAAPAIPELSKRFLQRENPVSSAGSALGGIGTEEAILPLLQGLKHDDYGVRKCAISALGSMGKKAGETIPAIIESTKDEDERVRHEAVVALSNIKSRPDLSVPALIKCLTDPEPYVWEQTIRALREFGTDAKAATPELLQIHKKYHDDFSITFEIEYTLEETDPQTATELEIR